MASLARHQPTWDRFVLLVDARIGRGEPEPGCTTVSLAALPLPAPRPFTFRYTILELSTAVKPWMFAHLFARGYDRVVYLDPDIELFSPLAELETVAPDTLLLLTPHLTGVDRQGDDHPSERVDPAGRRLQPRLPRGVAAAGARRLPALVAGGLEFQCVAEVERGLFVDQKWMDLAPGLFPGVAILRHDGWNVAYWNLRQRTRAARARAPDRQRRAAAVLPLQRRRARRCPGSCRSTTAGSTLDAVGDAAPLIERYRERDCAPTARTPSSARRTRSAPSRTARRFPTRRASPVSTKRGSAGGLRRRSVRAPGALPRGPRPHPRSGRGAARAAVVPPAVAAAGAGRPAAAARPHRDARAPAGRAAAGVARPRRPRRQPIARAAGRPERRRLPSPRHRHRRIGAPVPAGLRARRPGRPRHRRRRAGRARTARPLRRDRVPRQRRSHARRLPAIAGPVRRRRVEHRLLALGAGRVARRVDRGRGAARRDLGAEHVHPARPQPAGDDPGRAHAARRRGHRRSRRATRPSSASRPGASRSCACSTSTA